MDRPISKKKLLDYIQKLTAVQAVSTSAVRGHSAGTKVALQTYLGRMHLGAMPRESREEFLRWLNGRTKAMQRRLPDLNRPWGVARKTLNLFLRGCLYNHHLRRAYGFRQVEPWLEVALDSVVAGGLIDRADDGALPEWPRLMHLSREQSEQYQRFAQMYACWLDLPARVYLDNILWLDRRQL